MAWAFLLLQDTYVICKIFKKSGLGPRKGEQHGACFIEEEWNEKDDDKIKHGIVLSSAIEKPSSSKPADCQTKGTFPEQSEDLMAQEDNSTLDYFNPTKLLQEFSNNDDGAHINGFDEVSSSILY